MEGIEAARKSGLRVKINTVALKGFNEEELFPLIDWCAGEGHDLTFIEVMPMGEMGEEMRLDQYWPLKDLRARLAERFHADRSGRAHWRPRALCAGGGDRAEARVHHAAHP